MPNLEEIMAEFRAKTKETVAESVKKFPMEESQKKNGGKEEVEVGKERKRKRGEDEEEEESSGSDDEDFLSNEAFELMQKTLLKKGFIGERGFKEKKLHPLRKSLKREIGLLSACICQLGL